MERKTQNISKMKKISIFGAGGFAHEVFWLAKQCGFELMLSSTLILVDILRYQNLIRRLFESIQHLAVVAVANPKIREKMFIKFTNSFVM